MLINRPHPLPAIFQAGRPSFPRCAVIDSHFLPAFSVSPPMMLTGGTKGKQSCRERPSCLRAVIKLLREAGPPSCRMRWGDGLHSAAWPQFSQLLFQTSVTLTTTIERAQNHSPRLEVSWNAGAKISPSAFHLIPFRADNWHNRIANQILSASERSIREEMFWVWAGGSGVWQAALERPSSAGRFRRQP